MRIPKIIHQTGPIDKSKWHPNWEVWSNSWKIHFPDFGYILWNDESMDEFMKTNFRDFYESHYSKYTKHIQRVDVWRYFCLYKYGGIYADLDFECFYNFYDELDHEKVNVAESPYAPGEPVQNALMASPANHPFWTYVFSDLEKQIVKRDFIDVLFTTGPGLIYREIKRTTRQQLSNILPYEKYAGIANPMKKGEYSHHHGTCVWNV